MRADSFAGQVLAVISRRAPAFQPRAEEPSSFAGAVLYRQLDLGTVAHSINHFQRRFKDFRFAEYVGISGLISVILLGAALVLILVIGAPWWLVIVGPLLFIGVKLGRETFSAQYVMTLLHYLRKLRDAMQAFPLWRIRISPKRLFLTTSISLLAVTVVAFFGAQAAANGPDRRWWTLGAVAASVIAAGVPAYEQIRKERLRARTERAAVDAAVAMRVTLNDALDPIVRQLGRVATATNWHEREALQQAAILMVVDSAAHLVGSGRVRACLFRFAPGPPRVLMPTQYSGRVDDPLEPIVEGTVAGDLVFDMIRHNQHLYSPDLDADPPPGWRVRPPQTYKSLAAVPVVAGQNAFGMLMVDTLENDGIRRADVPLVRLLAGLLADALAAGSEDG